MICMSLGNKDYFIVIVIVIDKWPVTRKMFPFDDVSERTIRRFEFRDGVIF